jgi:hypothetical protein
MPSNPFRHFGLKCSGVFVSRIANHHCLINRLARQNMFEIPEQTGEPPKQLTYSSADSLDNKSFRRGQFSD